MYPSSFFMWTQAACLKASNDPIYGKDEINRDYQGVRMRRLYSVQEQGHVTDGAG